MNAQQKNRLHGAQEQESWFFPHQRDGVELTLRQVDEFVAFMRAKGMEPGSIEIYRKTIQGLYDRLPENKIIHQGTLEWWKESLQQDSYAVRTVNRCISIGNQLVEFLGHREYQTKPLALEPSGAQPELSRNEYLQMLYAAMRLGREQAYYLVKIFANTDLPVQQCSDVTVEAVRSGGFLPVEGESQKPIRLHRSLCQELLQYAERRGIQSGPIFCTKNGTPLRRSQISKSIQRLCLEANIPVEKGNPRCLRNLYKETLRSIYSNIDLLAEQAYEQLLEWEQLTYGWRETEQS